LNGLSAKDGYAALEDLCASLKSRHDDAMAISEPNLDFLQAPTREAILKICKIHFEYAQVITSTTCIRAPSTWKPGGTLLIVVGKWAQAVVRKWTDDLERWASVTLTGQESTAVTIYSAYDVVKTTIKESGPDTVFAQQWQLLRMSGVASSPDPHQRFISDLRRDIQTRVLNTEVIVLAGDFNEQLGKDPNLLASICGGFDLFDAHEFQHGEHSMVPTYIRGRKRLDYCLLSPELAPFVTATGLNLFNEYYHSNHRALFLEIDLAGYLGAKLPKLARPNQRFVSSSSRHVAKFITKVHSHLEENRIFYRFAEYLLDINILPEPWKEANGIDNMLGQALADGERECLSLLRHPWSENLHRAS
jgi:hypothetical protein